MFPSRSPPPAPTLLLQVPQCSRAARWRRTKRTSPRSGMRPCRRAVRRFDSDVKESTAVIARSEATTRLRLLRKLRRAGSPPKLGERRRKQSSFLCCGKLDCFASLAMTQKHRCSFPRLVFARVAAISLALFDQRAQGKPGADCARSPVCESNERMHTDLTGTAETSRLSPRNGFTAYTKREYSRRQRGQERPPPRRDPYRKTG